MFKERHLPKLIFLTPIMTVGLLTLFILSFFIFIERANLHVESLSLEQKLLQTQKTKRTKRFWRLSKIYCSPFLLYM